MHRALTVLLAAVFCAASLAGCGERPQRLVTDGEKAYNGDNQVSPLRERTLKQGEAGRMGD